MHASCCAKSYACGSCMCLCVCVPMCIHECGPQQKTYVANHRRQRFGWVHMRQGLPWGPRQTQAHERTQPTCFFQGSRETNMEVLKEPTAARHVPRRHPAFEVQLLRKQTTQQHACLRQGLPTSPRRVWVQKLPYKVFVWILRF